MPDNSIILNGKYRLNFTNILRSNGKFGNTYTGTLDNRDQKVIIKQLSSALKSKPYAIERFRREVAFQVEHPNIAAASEYFEQEGEHYIVRPYIEGRNIREHLKTYRLKGKERLEFVINAIAEIAEALHALHNKGVFHRDIRPANILIDSENNSAVLIDFGLAKTQGEEETGRIPFSLIYSPPEQVLDLNELVDASSDIYSLGITVYELLTGTPAFHHNNPELLMNIMLSLPLAPSKKVPDALLAILNQATCKLRLPLPPHRYSRNELKSFLKKGREGRYQDALEFKNDLIQATKAINTAGGPVNRWFKKLTAKGI